MYWLVAALDDPEAWNLPDLLESLEKRFIELVKKEIEVQKQIEKDLDSGALEDEPEGLQTMHVQDVLTI